MGRVVYRPDHPQANENGMVDIEVAGPKHGGGDAFYVISDETQPIRHMADGQYYTSKAKFRQATKAAGCIEIGNEISTVTQPRKPVPLSREQRVNDIKKAIEQLRARANR